MFLFRGRHGFVPQNSEPELPIGIKIELENTKYEGSEVANVVAVQFGPELEDSSLFVSEVVNDIEPGPVDKSLPHIHQPTNQPTPPGR